MLSVDIALMPHPSDGPHRQSAYRARKRDRNPGLRPPHQSFRFPWSPLARTGDADDGGADAASSR